MLMNEIYFIQDNSNNKISLTRIILCYSIIASALPYIILKLLWLSGNNIGMNDPHFFNTKGFLIGNIVSFLMDAFLIVLALGLTYNWGLKLPGKLLVFFIWCATGLLAPIAVSVGLSMLIKQDVNTEKGPLKLWVFQLVYFSFTIQGALLCAAFSNYTKKRWRKLFIRHPKVNAGYMNIFIAILSLFIIVCIIIIRVAWLFGLKTGMPEGMMDFSFNKLLITNLSFLVFDILILVGGIYFLNKQRHETIKPFVFLFLWFGAGTVFTWGCWEVFTAIGFSKFNGSVYNLISIAKIVCGMCVVTAFAKPFLTVAG